MNREDMLARLLAQAADEGADLVTLRAMVEEGGYLTLLPRRLAQAELAAGRWVALDAPGFAWQRPIMAYTRGGEPQSAPLARFLQALRLAAAQAPGAPPVPTPAGSVAS